MQSATRSGWGYPMCEGQRWIFIVLMILLWYTGLPSLSFDPKDPASLGLEPCWRLIVNLAQLGLNLPTAWLTAQAFSNCATHVYIYIHYLHKNFNKIDIGKLVVHSHNKMPNLSSFRIDNPTPRRRWSVVFWDHGETSNH